MADTVEIMPALLKSPRCRNFRFTVQQPTSVKQQLITLSNHKSVIMSNKMQTLAMTALSLVVIIILSFSTNAAFSADDSVKIIAQSSFIDHEGKLNIVGTVRNTGALPVQAILGLEVQDENGIRIEQQQQPTYGRIILPLNDSPFKFVINSGTA